MLQSKCENLAKHVCHIKRNLQIRNQSNASVVSEALHVVHTTSRLVAGPTISTCSCNC